MAKKKQPPALDVYASPYVPQALKQFNQLPVHRLLSLPFPWTDYRVYVQTFAGSDHLEARAPSTVAPVFGPGSHVASQLNDKSYSSHFGHAITQEVQALEQECEAHALYQVPLLPARGDPRPFVYWINVPGLRETSLRVEIGDIVYLRQLHLGPIGEILEAPHFQYAGQWFPVPPYVNAEYASVVWGIDRLNERLTLRVDCLEPMSLQFNACFTVQSGRIDALRETIHDVGKLLTLEGKAKWMRRMLIPEPDDGAMQRTLNKGTIDWEPKDALLNYEQVRAIDNVLSQSYGTLPFIISGPPGTGKTKTLVELALQLIAAKPGAHLLVCAPSDPAADTLTQRLREHLTPKQLLRLNPPSRSFPEVPMSILPFCFVDQDMFSIPPFSQIMRCQIVVTTCRDAEILLRARLSNTDLCKLERQMQHSLHPEEELLSPPLHWTGLLIDEAAQAIEPEACVPLCVVAPPQDYETSGHVLPLFVKAGDQNQLGPRTASKSQTIQTSLFERLLARPTYSEHPLARSKQSRVVMRPLTQKMLPILRPPFANLIRNYRSHPAILATPSALFYNDTLEPEARETDSLLAWPGWNGREWPVLFAPNTGLDEIEQDGGG
ncbi:hypothetical protein LTR53_002061 [Teratosphaeriaceae sp. CCFEE 6253]|nr:hypothetical protein LTR53_002061 [Teratosphaeriaceae sp. CCFEE 6253]